MRSVAVLVCLAIPSGSELAAQSAGRGTSGTTSVSPAAMTLKQNMRKLWTDHVVWTRDYIVAAVGDQPDAQAAANRLMRNQDDIGNAVAAYYGAPAGQQLTKLLKEHITIAVDLIKAAKAGDKPGSRLRIRGGKPTASRLPTSSVKRIRTGPKPRSQTS